MCARGSVSALHALTASTLPAELSFSYCSGPWQWLASDTRGHVVTNSIQGFKSLPHSLGCSALTFLALPTHCWCFHSMFYNWSLNNFCASIILVTFLNYCDEIPWSKATSRRVYSSRGRVPNGRRGIRAGRHSRGLRDHISIHMTKADGMNWKWGLITNIQSPPPMMYFLHQGCIF